MNARSSVAGVEAAAAATGVEAAAAATGVEEVVAAIAPATTAETLATSVVIARSRGRAVAIKHQAVAFFEMINDQRRRPPQKQQQNDAQRARALSYRNVRAGCTYITWLNAFMASNVVRAILSQQGENSTRTAPTIHGCTPVWATSGEVQPIL